MNPTQQMIKRLFLSIAISVAALIAGTGSATADVTRCDGALPTGIYENLFVPKGGFCDVANVDVFVLQNVELQEGALLLVNGSNFTVNGNLNGDGVRIGESLDNLVVMINGNVTITGSRGFALLDVNIDGQLHISRSGGFGSYRVENSRITGNVLLENNRREIRFVENQVVGNLSCNANDPAPVLGSPDTNTVGGKRIGQCSQ